MPILREGTFLGLFKFSDDFCSDFRQTSVCWDLEMQGMLEDDGRRCMDFEHSSSCDCALNSPAFTEANGAARLGTFGAITKIRTIPLFAAQRCLPPLFFDSFYIRDWVP